MVVVYGMVKQDYNMQVEQFSIFRCLYSRETFLLIMLKMKNVTWRFSLWICSYLIKNSSWLQERIISSLSLKSSSGELESYCLMWSLQPFIDEEISHKAWRLVAWLLLILGLYFLLKSQCNHYLDYVLHAVNSLSLMHQISKYESATIEIQCIIQDNNVVI